MSLLTDDLYRLEFTFKSYIICYMYNAFNAILNKYFGLPYTGVVQVCKHIRREKLTLIQIAASRKKYKY